MPAKWNSAPPRRVRSGGALTLVFVGVLATGAATGSWGGDESRSADRDTAARIPVGDVEEPAREGGEPREAEPRDAAEELVSRSGDRWSSAYSAREYDGLRRKLDGEYVGTGISVSRQAGADTGADADERTVRVTEVAPDSPAARAGIRPGDRLRSVNGTSVATKPVTEVVAMLRGTAEGTTAADPGSAVRLGLTSEGRDRTETVRRVRLSAETVVSEQLSPDVNRIKIAHFTEDSGQRVREAVRSTPDGAGILLDLRGNSGGLVTEAAEAASALLDGGLVATWDDDGEQRSLYAEEGGNTESPVVVLVDGGTMSAAELLAGALQDRGRAVVVGNRTFGKASVQVPHEMADGSVAELTVGHYVTPAGRDLRREGLTPDLAVETEESALNRARTVLSGLASGS
ncbi:S41 family peptidase [Streptomyces oceani]|uniref:Peptidase S41 n=1 Tax=Streptomyces oceani TaxID=1075402 RepID=A0A1E7KGF6_9ACTN|nr:S41 family peptidase [Streptomyces oceani]OEV03009.1 peptidase S41 [Streptomyces oceani]